MAHYFTNDENLKSEIRKNSVNIKEVAYYFYTDNGVFSKDGIDFGTRLLLETVELTYPPQKSVLDIGCGCGPIGIYLAKQGFKVHMTDVNKRALHLAKMALKEQYLDANVIMSNAYEAIDEKYDYIISNPPIRAGKNVLYDIVMGAKKYLKEAGELWIVVRKKQGAESLVKDMKEVYKNVQVITKKKGYFIIKAT